jgi:hypothetical protein
VVNKKKKAVLVQELRDRKYEAFPPKDNKKAKSTDEELGKDDAEEEETDPGARDYDYLLSVGSSATVFPCLLTLLTAMTDAYLVAYERASREAQEPDRR